MNREIPRFKVQQRRDGSWGVLDTHKVRFVADRADQEFAQRHADSLNAGPFGTGASK